MLGIIGMRHLERKPQYLPGACEGVCEGNGNGNLGICAHAHVHLHMRTCARAGSVPIAVAPQLWEDSDPIDRLGEAEQVANL